MTIVEQSLRDFVLLVNSREDKGYKFILDIAARCPDIPFVAIASQTDESEARRLVRENGTANVLIHPRTDEISTLYNLAKVVVVPSYRFIETFSRVCIEAHRFGKPVIGSNTGNVPHLLERSGIVLPEVISDWVNELRRLFDDEKYYLWRSNAALTNSARYSYKGQRDAILNIVRTAGRPLLLGIGSGIGNMTHVSPLIRHLAQQLRHRIDIVVSEDYSNSLFLLQNSKWVNAVFSLRPHVLSKRYDTVFITHCFGPARVRFNARRVVWSRDWAEFRPDHHLHEAVFNFEAAKQLLGIDYDERDTRQYYLGEVAYRRPAGKLVGLHGGSKTGFWASKRWPYYSEFAASLQRLGFRVASFGTSEEYVEGTEDMTGGSIEEMARRMCDCSFFVGNDSGVMHVANSLGIPLIAIFGPTNPATRAPLRSTSRAVSLTKSCAPCECNDKVSFQSGNCRCIGEIHPSTVLESFHKMLNEWPPLTDDGEPGLDQSTNLGGRAARQDHDPAYQAQTPRG